MRVKDKRAATVSVKGLMLDLQGSSQRYVRGLIEVYRVYDVLSLRGPTFITTGLPT